VGDPEYRHFPDLTQRPFGSHHFGSCQALYWLIPASSNLKLCGIALMTVNYHDMKF
jgi:hypothetical protein